ncbi:MAG: hypothetical protein GKR89_07580 [Candidatus Latescibacteria bacterium]|nr:hypothetical protein [Candidatus Latescibacterota bacterium]
MSDTPVAIGSDRQLLLDHRLIGQLQDARQVLHRPVRRNAIVRRDRPWEEGGLAYAVLFKDGDRFRAWYRCIPHADNNKTGQACTAYIESRDGITWEKPSLGLINFQGSTNNNLIIDDPHLVNFAPFLDPQAPEQERYKGIGRHGAIYTATSPDGLSWHKNPTPVQDEGPFDSHNIAFRDPWTGQYVMYTRGIRRDGQLGHGATRAFKDGVRWIRRATSDDFVHWSPLEPITTGEAPLEHFYTNSCVPYPRSPGLYLMFPSRFVDGRTPIPDWPYPGVNDAVLMSSRDGLHFDRLFPEAFVRPGPDPDNWHERSIYIMRGLLQTGPAELSLYMTEHWRLTTTCIRRLTMRLDGFASVQGPYRGGQFTTKPLIFSGNQLRLNMSTSAAGSIRVEVQDEHGKPLPGLGLEDSPELFQDQIDLAVQWKSGADLGSLAGTPVRLRFVLYDADLYALRFCDETEAGDQ